MRNRCSFHSSLRASLLVGLMVAIAMALFAGTASARGYGLYLDYTRNIAAPGGDLGNPGPAILSQLDRNDVSVGLATDTNLAKDELINFRTDVGFHAALFANPIGQATFGNGYGGLFAWAMGFGIVRTEGMRVWLAPDVRFNFDYYGSTAGAPLTDFVDLQLGVGPRIGINLHTSDRATVTVSGGYNYKWGWTVLTNAGGIGTVSHRDHAVGVTVAIFWRSADDLFK